MTEANSEIELEWEDWDGRSPFIHHCIAGSIAGVAEHTLLYPFDTVKTHMQAYCSTCPKNPANQNTTTVNPTQTSSSIHKNSSLWNRHVYAERSGKNGTVTTAAGDKSMWSIMRSLVKHGHNEAVTSVGHLNSVASVAATTTAPVLKNTARHSFLPSTTSVAAVSTSITSSTTTSAAALVATISSSPSHSQPNHTTWIQQEAGIARLWRGVQSMAMGSIPAHALYFSSYEMVKSFFLSPSFLSSPITAMAPTTTATTSSSSETLHPLGASVAGAVATLLHDSIMCPMDTIKQRMQLGHYHSVSDAFITIVKTSGEGWIALYRSFGVTLLTNIPYGMIMMTTNEWLRGILMDWKTQYPPTHHVSSSSSLLHSDSLPKNHIPTRQLDVMTTLLAGCGAGTVAAGLTSPLDRVKTRLQTQRMGILVPSIPMSSSSSTIMGDCTAFTGQTCPAVSSSLGKKVDRKLQPQYNGLIDALRSILKEEGYMGLWRGVGPRILTQAPSVAISWSAYEVAKRWLAGHY